MRLGSSGLIGLQGHLTVFSQTNVLLRLRYQPGRLHVFFLLQRSVAWTPERTVLVRNQVGNRDDHDDNFNQCIRLRENEHEDAASQHLESFGQLT